MYSVYLKTVFLSITLCYKVDINFEGLIILGVRCFEFYKKNLKVEFLKHF